MNYIDIKSASEKWGISDRRIRVLCNDGRVDGAIKLGWSWTIPENAPKPRDGRVLRRFKNLDIRPGTVDISKLDALKESCPITLELKKSERIQALIVSVLSSLLKINGNLIEKEAIEEIFSGKIHEGLDLKDHLLVLNFRSIFLSLFDKDERWFERDLKQVYIRLLQGIDDISSSEYRDGFTRYAIRDKEKVKVPVQMETLFSQYENSWKNLNGLVSGVLLYGEILRIEPYSEYSDLFAYLILSGELLRNGILPPLFNPDDIDELKVSFSLALKRGNYSDFTHYIERSVFLSYGEVANV